MNEKWEYKCVSVAPGDGEAHLTNEEMLNKLGDEGWELVTVAAPGYEAFLKRRKN